MRLKNAVNISLIAIAVNGENSTFRNNISTVFETLAIHEVSQLQPSLELLGQHPMCVSPQSFLFYASIKPVMSCGPRYMPLPIHSSTIIDNVVETCTFPALTAGDR